MSDKSKYNNKENNNKDKVKNNKKKRKTKYIPTSEYTINYNFLIFAIFCILVIFVIITGRLFYWQFVCAEQLKKGAYNQQILNKVIEPKRGNIYDVNGLPLALSYAVDTITINPELIVSSSENSEIKDIKTKEMREKLAKAFSEIFELDYSETLAKINSSDSVVTIAKKVEQDKVTLLKNWMAENKFYSGINITEDTKRTYPYNNLASHVIGFCGTDNQGLSGLEYSYDDVLKGTSGKLVSYKSRSQDEIPDTEQLYVEAQDGQDLTLTLDVNIQMIAEKNIKEAVEENSCENGGNVIIMSPKTGDILAMASYPDYNLNTPFTPNEALAATYDSLSDQEKSDALFKMWRNKSVNELYEPGSVFKIITSAIALEENITGTDIANDFHCNGSEKFSDGTTINCWKTAAHGLQDLRHALMNSCNPAFMQLGSRIGKETLYKYYRAFGLMDKTGVGLSEENSLFIDYDKVREVELATMSFGQRLNITPLQMITAISAVANDGVLVQPHIVKSISNNSYVQNTDVNEVRQVISASTAQKVKSMMFSVVDIGTGKAGGVEGYSVGGKTGTSEPLDSRKEDGYIASFVAVSPADDPEIAILLCLYKPTGLQHQGGEIAAPAVSKILTEVLPLLEISTNDN